MSEGESESATGTASGGAAEDSTEMPCAEFNMFYSFVKEVDQLNYKAKCKLCPNKTLSVSYSSRNNLRSHLIVSKSQNSVEIWLKR